LVEFVLWWKPYLKDQKNQIPFRGVVVNKKIILNKKSKNPAIIVIKVWCFQTNSIITIKPDEFRNKIINA
jgi:hypothetical protein